MICVRTYGIFRKLHCYAIFLSPAIQDGAEPASALEFVEAN